MGKCPSCGGKTSKEYYDDGSNVDGEQYFDVKTRCDECDFEEWE